MVITLLVSLLLLMPKARCLISFQKFLSQIVILFVTTTITYQIVLHILNTRLQNSSYSTKIYVGLYNKTDEFLIALYPITPQVICLTQHHLTTEQISTITLDQYTLGASFCRQTYKHGGTCIYVSKDIQFHAIRHEWNELFVVTLAQ